MTSDVNKTERLERMFKIGFVFWLADCIKIILFWVKRFSFNFRRLNFLSLQSLLILYFIEISTTIMFRFPPSIHLAIPKKHHKILSVVATGMLMLGTSLLGLSLGTDHWRESFHNGTLTIQGLVHECDTSANVIKCIAITRSTFASGLLGHLEIIYGLLIESAILGALCHLASVIASFHRRAILVTAVVATEITAATAGIMAMVCFSVKFLERPWKAGWSYGMAWLGSLTIYLAAVFHFILQDVKFLGKKFCM